MYISKAQTDILANLHPIYGFLPGGGALSKLVLKSPPEKTHFREAFYHTMALDIPCTLSNILNKYVYTYQPIFSYQSLHSL